MSLEDAEPQLTTDGISHPELLKMMMNTCREWMVLEFQLRCCLQRNDQDRA